MNRSTAMAVARCAVIAAIAAACSLAVPCAFAADAQEIHISRQYGLPYIPLVIIEQKKLLEKHLKLVNAGDAKISWATVGTTTATLDGLLSGNIDFASAGITAVLQLWNKTLGTPYEIRAISGISSFAYPLVTNNPNVKTLADFGPKDRIAVPAVKVSVQAIVLQMAAAKAFGPDKGTALDERTVSLAHPDAAVAVISKQSEINSHFSYPPYSRQELATPGVHAVLWSNDVTNGPSSTIEVVTTARVLKDHPQWVTAWLAAQEEANAFIMANPREAAQIYLDATKEKLTVDDLVAILADPMTKISTTPYNTMIFARYMHGAGQIKTLPSSWKDYFFPVGQNYPGS